MEVAANQSIPLPKKYQQDTEKYSSQVSRWYLTLSAG